MDQIPDPAPPVSERASIDRNALLVLASASGRACNRQGAQLGRACPLLGTDPQPSPDFRQLGHLASYLVGKTATWLTELQIFILFLWPHQEKRQICT